MVDPREFRVLCPACDGGLLQPPSTTAPEAECEQCRTCFPVDRGIVDLIPAVYPRRTLA